MLQKCQQWHHIILYSAAQFNIRNIMWNFAKWNQSHSPYNVKIHMLNAQCICLITVNSKQPNKNWQMMNVRNFLVACRLNIMKFHTHTFRDSSNIPCHQICLKESTSVQCTTSVNVSENCIRFFRWVWVCRLNISSMQSLFHTKLLLSQLPPNSKIKNSNVNLKLNNEQVKYGVLGKCSYNIHFQC